MALPTKAPRAERPGAVLSAMAALSIILILVPTVGVPAVLLQSGLLSPRLLSTMIGWPGTMALLAMAPALVLIVMAATFVIAFLTRAAWGPRIVAGLALAWGLTAGSTTILIPLLHMPGGLAPLSIVLMTPGVVGPILFGLGFAGFLLRSDVARMWFRHSQREPGA